ncbi:M17 family metallopeptidase [Roseivirga sp. BDSF3-8]|uniref:leucyl aminopeptidase family protein n=1 Tax=Roseivirga sp. BDSF3-8 TaxID=3241598 RepID=UPI003531B186
MEVAIKTTPTLLGDHPTVSLSGASPVKPDYCPDELWGYVQNRYAGGQESAYLWHSGRNLAFFKFPQKSSDHILLESRRKQGFEALNTLAKDEITSLQIDGHAVGKYEVLAFLEGYLLSSYSFTRYKSEKKANPLKEVFVHADAVSQADLDEIKAVVQGVFAARDLVNTPVIDLNAEQFSEEIKSLGQKHGFDVDVFNESKILSLKMGGLLAVNAGSEDPPTFNILEYKPDNSINDRPIVLVGKGVMYDTGGLSLKPTPNSMDMMKSDMGGAACVAGAFAAVAAARLPIHLVGLIPATDNRLNGNAVAPGDVITMYSGKTVEVMNTDAEGRLILADALHYAKKYNPELVMDFATLTGAAMRAIGKEGIVCMGTAAEQEKAQLIKAGEQAYERLVEFPLWEEYKAQLHSDIADISNLGGDSAGAITAGVFLQYFTDYPWMHFDIAGSAFLKGGDSYKGKGGTGAGVRLLFTFLKNGANG